MTQVVSSKPTHENFVARFFVAPSQSKSIGNFEVDLFFPAAKILSLTLFFLLLLLQRRSLRRLLVAVKSRDEACLECPPNF